MADGLLLSLAIFLLALGGLARIGLGLRRMRQVSDLPDELPQPPPKVSVVVSALNEAATIEPALRSLLALDYPALEVVAIDDRSTDATGAILDRMAAQDPRLRVIHIAELPPGWLGKSHALHIGAQAATGDWLLFTDADIVFERRALRQTVAWCVANHLDHLSVMPDFTTPHPLLGALVTTVSGFLLFMHPPWLVRESKDQYFGAGAFNLVSAAAHRRLGGHEPLRLAVVDDMMLARLVKAHGLRQDALLGRGSVMVEWYPDAAALARGLEKNCFAMFDYRLTRVVGACAALLVGRYWPLVGLFITSGVAWWLNLGSVACILALQWLVMRQATRVSARSLAWSLLASGFMAVVLLRGTLLTLRRGGIDWRGTRYALEELRRAHQP